MVKHLRRYHIDSHPTTTTSLSEADKPQHNNTNDGTGDETNTADEDNTFWKELAKDKTVWETLEAAYVKDEQ